MATVSASAAAVVPGTTRPGGALTVGVEEEFLLVDPSSRLPVPLSVEVLDTARAGRIDQRLCVIGGGADDVRAGDIVLLRTDWTDRMYGRWPDYFTQSPYCPPETAEWLVARGVKNIGFDFFEEYCARLPDFSSEDFPMHRVILGAGVVIMEGLTNLGALPRRRVDFAAPFYKIAGTEGAPARFFATVDRGMA